MSDTGDVVTEAQYKFTLRFIYTERRRKRIFPSIFVTARGILYYPIWKRCRFCFLFRVNINKPLKVRVSRAPHGYINDKNAFQWNAYRPLVDRIPACIVAGGEGVPAQEGCTCQGVPAWGVYLPRVYLPGGCTCPGECLASTPPLWTEWLTDRCKNITFANFICRR